MRFVTEDRFDVLDNSDAGAPRALDPPLRSLPFALGQTTGLINTDPGVTRVASSTLQVGAPQPVALVTDPTEVPGNGYSAQTLSFSGVSALNGQPERVVSLSPNASARESATALSTIPGVRATAYTELKLTDFVASPTLGPPALQLNGIALGPIGSPEDLVSVVNSNEGLASRGIQASLVNGQAVVSSAYGDDLSLSVNGAPEASVTATTDRGQTEVLQGQGIGDPPVLIGTADLRQPITLSSTTDYTLFVSNGSDDGATVTLTGSFADATELVFALQEELDAALGPNQVQVGLNPGGQLRIVGRDSGSAASLTVIPNGPLGNLLGIGASTINGNERYSATTVGGVIALELAEGIEVQSEGSGPFTAEPTVSSPAAPFTLKMTGSPQAGDAFAVSFSGENPLGNAIGLELVELQSRGFIGLGEESVSEAIAEAIEYVGLRGSQAQTDEQAASVLLAQSQARVESVRGVNLDEEAADLIRFEQAYNASAQVISVARDIFNTLFQAIA